MKKSILLPLIAAITAFSLIGCIAEKNTENVPEEVSTTEAIVEPSEVPTEETIVEDTASILTKISASDAKKMMDEVSDVIILDVRTEEEYNAGHIEGAFLIPDYEIETKAEELLEDKSATILIYCRSGRRSALAAQILNNLGYTKIYDFGGIIDWSYDIVTE